MEVTERPTIYIQSYNINETASHYKSLVSLTKEDIVYLNKWREKARKLYKKYNGLFSEEDEKYLVDPDPFEAKWFIFRIKPKSRKNTPMPSPCLSIKSFGNENDDGYDLLAKFELNP